MDFSIAQATYHTVWQAIEALTAKRRLRTAGTTKDGCFSLKVPAFTVCSVAEADGARSRAYCRWIPRHATLLGQQVQSPRTTMPWEK